MSGVYDGERTFQDLKRMNSMIGRTYYERGEGKFKGMIRTYYMRFNSFANKITPAVSNWHHAEPTEDMLPYHPKIMSAVMTAKLKVPVIKLIRSDFHYFLNIKSLVIEKVKLKILH